MAMSVTVLCPNGRRVNVKVTPNTSILQIIEDACKKEKFDPDEYDLKHIQRILDTSNTVRYANIPNKSQLELVKCAIPRKASSITVNIATDTGLRLVHEFPADTTLWKILHHHEQQGNEGLLIPPVEGENEPVIVYTMRRISGDQLKSTTLKSLGLTGGKCMLRHSIQKASSSGQAHVSTPLSRPKTSKEDNDTQTHRIVNNDSEADSVQRQRHVENHVSPPPVVPQHQQQQAPVEVPQQEIQSSQHQQHLPDINMQSRNVSSLDVVVTERPDVITSAQDNIPDIIQPQDGVLQPDVVADKSNNSQQPVPMDILEGLEGASAHSAYCHAEVESESMQVEERVIKLGSHDAILFSMDDAPSTHVANEDDSFFELTVDEVKALYREQQRTLRSFEDAPLLTKQMRDMHESAKVLSALNQYPITQLRIYFPDNNVIQGVFRPTETIADVVSFLKQYLADPSANFSLSLRHPPRFLTPEMTLVEADCIPNARLYFSSSSPSPYLSEETLAKKSSFNSACNTLKRRQHREMSSFSCREENPVENSSQASSVVISDEANYQKRTNANMHATGAVKKVPKWFKTGK